MQTTIDPMALFKSKYEKPKPYEFTNTYYPIEMAQAVAMFFDECEKLGSSMNVVKIAFSQVCQKFKKNGKPLPNGLLAIWIVKVHHDPSDPISVQYRILMKNRETAPKTKKKVKEEYREQIDQGLHRMIIPRCRADKNFIQPPPQGAITEKEKLKMKKIDLTQEFSEGVDKALEVMKNYINGATNEK